MHPDAEIYLSLPGLGLVLGARAMAEFGDDRTRFLNPKARKSYAGTAPITKASGNRQVVLARVARNPRLAHACYLCPFSSLTRSEAPDIATTLFVPAARPLTQLCELWPTA